MTDLASAGRPIEPSGSEIHYSGGVCLDHSDPSSVFASVEGEDGWDIRHFKMVDGQVAGSGQVMEGTGGTKHIRPVVERSGRWLLWVSGRYDGYQDFQTWLRIRRIC